MRQLLTVMLLTVSSCGLADSPNGQQPPIVVLVVSDDQQAGKARLPCS